MILPPEPPCPPPHPSASQASGTAQSPQQSSTEQDVVTFDDEGVRCARRNGLVESVRWDDLRIVFIETTNQGPFVDDMFWVLGGNSGGCIVPSEAKGCNELLARLQQLPGFDNKAVILAAQSTENSRFVCWHHEDISLKDVD
jgi:hypothetical protein